ncbi:MAG: hypothetical protein LBF68_02135 [Christensenellaceae bacterium]|nr:hypothetical protein [Christensenellaceae bacterium]
MMGTIHSGYISDMDFTPPQIDVQRQMGELLQLSYRERELLDQLSKKKAMLVNAANSNLRARTQRADLGIMQNEYVFA